MSADPTDPRDLLRAKLNAETGKLSWKELERHYARGAIIKVSPGMDMVEVAVAIAQDDTAAVAAWIAAGQIARASQDDAQAWHASDACLWAVVAAPWVLVQAAA